MRYRFRGLLRETGKPVEGHVEAPTVDQAYDLMADNGIVCESLREDPRMGDYTSAGGPMPGDGGYPPYGGTGPQRGGPGTPPPAGGNHEFASAIDSALDTSSTQVNVDDLWRKYRGQRVRVIDRDKIRQRVMSVVTKALQQSLDSGSTRSAQVQTDKTLERVEEALTKMFGDNKNLTSEVPTGQVAMEDQINRLNQVAITMEKTMAQLTMVMRRGGGGWGGGGGGADHSTRGAMIKSVKDPKNDKVLLEIFETNLKLQRSVDKKTAPQNSPSSAADPAPAG